MLPILHLNGYKIANPTVLARIGDAELTAFLQGYGHKPYLVDGDDPDTVHQLLAATLDTVFDEITEIQRAAREDGVTERPRWPMIVLRTPKGWTGPKVVDGLPAEGTWHAHQVPLTAARGDAAHLDALHAWMTSYRPGELFDDGGAPQSWVVDWLPRGDLRMSANPHTNGGRYPRDLELPAFRDYAVKAGETAEATRVLGGWLRDVMTANAAYRNFRLVGPDETESNRLGAVLDTTGKAWQARVDDVDQHLDRQRPGHGDPVRDHLPGVAGGIPADRPARAVLLLRGVHPHRRLDVQPARQMVEGDPAPGVAQARPVAELPAHLARLAALRTGAGPADGLSFTKLKAWSTPRCAPGAPRSFLCLLADMMR